MKIKRAKTDSMGRKIGTSVATTKDKTKKSNPYKANQFNVDPRQQLFLANYLDPKSKTFSNAYQSALKAGYEEEYAKNITGQDTVWLSESIRDNYLVSKAEDNLKKFLENDDNDKIQADMTKFTLERLNKKKYSLRSEVQAEVLVLDGLIKVN